MVDAPHAALDALCEAEVHALHACFESWFDGRSEAAGFARIEAALAPGFVMVDPRGAALERDALLAGLRGLHASQAPGALRLRVADVCVEPLADDLRLVRYVEHHEGQRASRRRSSAVLRRDAEAPGGVRWLSVHETWIDGHAPAP